MRRLTSRLRRPPQPLVLLMGAALIVGLAWVYLVPPWQAPDEFVHYAYTESLVERGERPGDGPRLASTAQEFAGVRSNALQTAGVLHTQPTWSENAYERWQHDRDALSLGTRGDGGGPSGAAPNPPLYYTVEGLAYRAAGGDVFDRFYAMRVLSLLNLLATVAGTWLLAGEVFGRNRLLQLVAASVPGLHPMVVFVSSGLIPDSMMLGLWAVALWLGARILNRGFELPAVTGLVAAAVAAIAVKYVSYALLPGVSLVLGVAGVRLVRERRGKSAARAAVASAVLLGVAGAAVLVISGVLNRVEQVPPPDLSASAFGSYLWQFYLPPLWFMEQFGALRESAVYGIWIEGSWAAFGSLEVRLPGWIYAVLTVLTAIAAVAAVTALWRRRRARNLWIAGFLAVVTGALLAGLHWTEFVEIQTNNRALNQGRYLLPLIPAAGLAAAASLTLLPGRWRAAAAGVLVAGSLLLQIVSLGTVAGRYYA